MLKVSVVIPTYNKAHLIAKTIESVLSQSLSDFEIIVVDDGSTDNTVDVISTFNVKYIRQENQGPGAARNTGIRLSSGEYIAFLDTGDIYFKHVLEKSVNILDIHPKAGMSYGQAYVTDNKKKIVDIEPRLKSSCVRQGWEELENYLLTGYHATMSTVLVRRSCLDEVGGFRAAFRSGSEDLDLWIRLAKKYEIAYIAEPFVTWGPPGFTSTRSLNEWKKTNSVIIDSICNDLQLNPCLRHLRPIAYFRLYLEMAKRECRSKNMKTSRENLFQAIKIHPKSLFGRMGLSWLICFFRTWTPTPFQLLIINTYHYLMGVTRNKPKKNLI